MEHVYVPSVPAKPTTYNPVSPDTPVLVEVSPSAEKEEVVDIKTQGDNEPKVLTPAPENVQSVSDAFIMLLW